MIAADDGVSVFGLASIIIRNSKRIALSALIGAVLFGLPVLSLKQQYTATASFVPQGGGADVGSGLSTLAGQFGVTLPTGSSAQSPQFYSDLLHSRVLLEPIVLDTIPVAEQGGKRVPMSVLLGVDDESLARKKRARCIGTGRYDSNLYLYFNGGS